MAWIFLKFLIPYSKKILNYIKSNKFLRPTKEKVIIYSLILLIFGVPAAIQKCAMYPLGPDDNPELHCSEKEFEFYNLLRFYFDSTSTGNRAYPNYNPTIVVSYLIILYLVLSYALNLFYKLKK